MGRIPAAVTRAEAALKMLPYDEDVVLNAAKVLVAAGQVDRAELLHAGPELYPAGCCFSYAARCASPQNTPPRPGKASSRGRCIPQCWQATMGCGPCSAGVGGGLGGGATRPRAPRTSHTSSSTATIRMMNFMRVDAQVGGARCSRISNTNREPT